MDENSARATVDVIGRLYATRRLTPNVEAIRHDTEYMSTLHAELREGTEIVGRPAANLVNLQKSTRSVSSPWASDAIKMKLNPTGCWSMTGLERMSLDAIMVQKLRKADNRASELSKQYYDQDEQYLIYEASPPTSATTTSFSFSSLCALSSSSDSMSSTSYNENPASGDYCWDAQSNIPPYVCDERSRLIDRVKTYIDSRKRKLEGPVDNAYWFPDAGNLFDGDVRCSTPYRKIA